MAKPKRTTKPPKSPVKALALEVSNLIQARIATTGTAGVAMVLPDFSSFLPGLVRSLIDTLAAAAKLPAEQFVDLHRDKILAMVPGSIFGLLDGLIHRLHPTNPATFPGE